MAKSAKPRKKYHPKQWFSPFKFRSCDIEKLKDDFRKFEIICEMKLPNGTCDDQDLCTIRDFFNMVKIAFLFPEERCWLIPEAIAETVELVETASVAVATVTNRGRKTGSYVCTADELNAIRDFAEIAGEVCQKSIELCPRRFVKEYLAMKDLLKDKIGRVRLTEDIVRRAIDRYTNDVQGSMRKSAINPANQEQTS